MEKFSSFDPERFEKIAADRSLCLGQPLIFHADTPSTNDVAMRLCQQGAPHGLVVVTDHQSRGRGRRGRVWYSTHPGENLLFSVILRLSTESELLGSLTLAMGLGLRDALAPSLDQELRIKWPNDVLVNGRKLAGILVESQLFPGQIPAFIVGVGLNVHTRELPESIRSVATSLNLLGARVTDREVILADILECLNNRTLAWRNFGPQSVVADLRECDALQGKRITVDGVPGRSAGIDDTGALMFLPADEPKPRRILNGTVEFIESRD